MKKRRVSMMGVTVLLLLCALTISQCAPAAPTVVLESPTEAVAAPTEVALSPTEAPAVPDYKVAAIMPGPIEDSDFNSQGFAAVKHIRDVYGIQVDYSEKVSVADAERVAREYIGAGYNIIIFHGGQFVATAQTLAPEFPELTFVTYTAGANPDIEIGNVWNVGLRFGPGSYALGILAARMSETGKVAFVAGIQTPIFITALNAFRDAAIATDPSVEVVYNFTGDQNDAVKARQTVESMIGAGVDVIAVFLNQGVLGVHEAVLDADQMVYIMTITTDKSEAAPDNYITSLVQDFPSVWEYIVGQVLDGHPGGYRALDVGSGLVIAPYRNAPQEVQDEVSDIMGKITSGEMPLELDGKNLP